MQDRTESVNSLINQLKLKCPDNAQGLLVKLEAEFERQTTEIETLAMASSLPAASNKWRSYGMTAMQAKVCERLESAGKSGISKDGLMNYLYSNRHDCPDIKILDVMLCRIRKILLDSKAPYWVETVYGTGWLLHEGYPPNVTLQINKSALQKLAGLRAA